MKSLKVLTAAVLLLVEFTCIYASEVVAQKVPDNLVTAFEQQSGGALNTSAQIQSFMTILKTRIDGGANVNALSEYGLSPIIYAVTMASWEASSAETASLRNQLVTFLIANGASVNQASGDGWFALHYAIVGVVGLAVENPRLIEILCKAGADPAGKSQKRVKEFPVGTTPKDMLMALTLKPKANVVEAFASCK